VISTIGARSGAQAVKGEQYDDDEQDGMAEGVVHSKRSTALPEARGPQQQHQRHEELT